MTAGLVAVCGLIPARVQAQAGIEVVVVSRESRAPIAGAEVQIENPELGLSERLATDARGRARFVPLPTALGYLVRVEDTPAYAGLLTEAFALRSNSVRSVTIELAPRIGLTETVTVKPGRGNTRVNKLNAEIAATLDIDEVGSIPVQGRDMAQLLFRLPNVTQATGFYPEAPNVSVNGANGLYASYLVDGLDNNENFLGGQKFAVPTGFVQDVTVLTGSYSVEFGRTGNGVFNLTSRSGQNEAHGEAFYVTRPGASLDASSPFAGRDLSGNAVKDGFQRHQGGFVLGGPLRRDRTFFLLNAEYARDRKDNLLTAPALGVNETVRGYNEFLLVSAKVDQRWSPRWTSVTRLNVGRVSIDRQGGGLEGGATFPSAASTQDRDSVLASARSVYAGRRLVSETAVQFSRFRWNYGRARRPDRSQTTVLDPSGQTLAILGHPGYVFDETEDTFQLLEKVSYRAGRHSIKGGVDALSAGFSLAGGGNRAGNYVVQLNAPQLAAVRALGRGSALDVADLPAGVAVLDYAVELRPSTFGARQNLLGLYVEDSVRVSGRLALSFGARYDYDSLSKGGGLTGDKNNMAFRGAFSFSPGPGSVLRGGYGVFYEKNLYAIYSDALQQNSAATGFRYQLQQLITLGLLPAGADVGRMIFDGNLTANLTRVPYLAGPGSGELQGRRDEIVSSERRVLNPAGYPNAKTQQASLGFQKQFGTSVLLALDLIHSRSDGLPRLRDLNSPAPYPVTSPSTAARTPAAADASRPVAVAAGGARSILITENAGKARYYASTVTLSRSRGRDRYSYRASYTLSRLRNDTDDINFRAQDANDFAAEYGPSVNDRTHVASVVASLFPASRLSVSVAASLQSGQPLNRVPDARIFGTTDLNGDGRSFSDAYLGNSDRWPGAARNQERLPGSRVVDLGAQYTVSIRSRRVLELRADVFNVLNRVNLSGYSNNATQSNQIQPGAPGGPIATKNAGPMRQFQFGVRLAF